MSATRTRRHETVSVTVKGRLLDQRTFGDADEAASYKQASRAWAIKRGIVVEVWSDLDMSARAKAYSALMAQAG
jgi:hypothetical protein